MNDHHPFKVTKKHPFLKKGLFILLMPCVYEYYISDGDYHFRLSQSTIDHWIKRRFIKNTKS